jgi:hypothetical protein
MPFADRSTVFSAGFQQRLAAFGRALNGYLDDKAGSAEVEAALERVRRHRERECAPERVERLEMALRLVRRLGRGSRQEIPSLGKAIEAFVRRLQEVLGTLHCDPTLLFVQPVEDVSWDGNGRRRFRGAGGGPPAARLVAVG